MITFFSLLEIRFSVDIHLIPLGYHSSTVSLLCFYLLVEAERGCYPLNHH